MGTETLYVDGYSEINRQWAEVGVSPWLNDSDGNNINTLTDENLHDEFGYADPVNIDKTLDSVVAYFEVNGPSARNDQFIPSIHNGTDWQELAAIDPDGDGYIWYNQDISTILDSWAKVTGAKLRCRYNKSGSPATQTIYVRRAYLLVTYSAGTEHFQTITDQTGLLDTTTKVYTGYRTVTDLTGLLDSAAAAKGTKQTVTDLAGLLDSVATSLAYTKPLSDLAGLLESISAQADYVKSVTDQTGLLDIVALAQAFQKTIGEKAGLLDSVIVVHTPAGGGIPHYQTILDLAGLLDSVVVVHTLGRSRSSSAPNPAATPLYNSPLSPQLIQLLIDYLTTQVGEEAS